MEQVHAAGSATGALDPGIISASGLPLQPAVRQAIASMHARYFDSITLAQLASEVFVSPFHFSRIFARATGITPGRYLTAIRLFEAKRLLLTTSLTVSDIVCSVGYSSVGTFTSRFTRAVGMTPTQYRDPEVGELLVAIAPHFRRLPPLASMRGVCKGYPSIRVGAGAITGRVELPVGSGPANVLIGVFAEAVPQCSPIAFTGLTNTRSADFMIHGVPKGRWVVVAVAEHAAPATGESTYSMGTVACPTEVTAGTSVNVRIPMRAPRLTDPPMAITLAVPPTPTRNRMAVQDRPYLRAVA